MRYLLEFQFFRSRGYGTVLAVAMLVSIAVNPRFYQELAQATCLPLREFQAHDFTQI